MNGSYLDKHAAMAAMQSTMDVKMQNPMNVPSKEPPIHAEIQTLDERISYLRQQIQVLEGRLYSVLQEPRPETLSEVEEIRGGSGLCEKIYLMSMDVAAASKQVSYLIDRLEL